VSSSTSPRLLAREGEPATHSTALCVLHSSQPSGCPSHCRRLSSSSAARHAADESHEPHDPPPRASRLAGALLAACLSLCPPSSVALDAVSVGTCLLEKCQLQLAACIADEKCAESLVCLNRCNGTPDEAGCQIRCGDLYSDAVVKDFNACAVTQTKCVPQRVSEGLYPLPQPAGLVTALDVADLEGRWYISAGQNKLFDLFDCQVHYFTSPEPGKLFIRINWRVGRPNGQFYERSDLQRFVQDPLQPAALYNHGNEVLHYQDDWYVAAFDKEKYMLVYYRGRNDAWDGYGGAVLYTRSPSFDPADVPALKSAMEGLGVGLKWEDMQATDNTCKPEPQLQVVPPSDLDTLADDVEAELQSFSRGFTVLKGREKAAEKAAGRFLSAEWRQAEEKLLEYEEADRNGPLAGLARVVLKALHIV